MDEVKKANKRFTMRLTKEQLKELRIVAALNDMTMSGFVDMAIRNEIKRIRKEE